VGLEKVIVIAVEEKKLKLPFSIDYQVWLDYLECGALEKTLDPDLHLPSVPTNLPCSAAKRFECALNVTDIVSKNPSILHNSRTLASTIKEVSKSTGLSRKTIERWICEWLKSGRNPAAIVRKFLVINRYNSTKAQASGKKRGVKGKRPEFNSEAPTYEVTLKIKQAWDQSVVKRKKKWSDAYFDMLIDQYRIPPEAFSLEGKGYFLDSELIKKYRAPTWAQTRYRFRQYKKAQLNRSSEPTRGNRGKATDDVFGPGFFEIDATNFQIQLVSRLTKSKLVGRPIVYLIVDIFSGAIVGYTVTLENASWASAALALYNCFSSKENVFKRLNLPYTAEDWPCQELPNMLRADRAELVSNMGQEFPLSGIRVEITPAMVPEAKGTVEGKHAELKKPQPGRFNLPGRYDKIRKRRAPDGKNAAALDIFEFEQILVEIIMDINREPVAVKRIPPDALPAGAKAVSRIGFYKWGLEHRTGFTRTKGPNFVHEHLLTRAKGSLTPQGIHIKGEIFNCDRLRELGFLTAAIDNEIKLIVSYTPLLASEIYFYDQQSNSWEPAYNTDPEILRINASFSEAANYRSWQNATNHQAALNAHGMRKNRLKFVRQKIKAAVEKKQDTPLKTSKAKANIRENRAEERANARAPGFNGVLSTKVQKSSYQSPDSNNARTLHESDYFDRFSQLWKKVNENN
jgi:CRISPR/Cas system CSM-associated protein Csm2 small subunit